MEQKEGVRQVSGTHTDCSTAGSVGQAGSVLGWSGQSLSASVRASPEGPLNALWVVSLQPKDRHRLIGPVVVLGQGSPVFTAGPLQSPAGPAHQAAGHTRAGGSYQSPEQRPLAVQPGHWRQALQVWKEEEGR